MKISVVIPAYNEEKYLPRTLESIGQLDRKPDEIIVIDGGSTDKTPEVAKKYGATPVIVPHRGIGFARQMGVESAKGDIVAFTDADTVVPHDWLTKIEQTLSQEHVSAVYGGFRVPDGKFPYRFFINFIQPLILGFFHLINFPMAPGQNTSFLKKKALEAGGYPLDFKIAEDLEMARRLKTVGKVVYRTDNYVTSSGRRGDEGFPMYARLFKAFWIYFTSRRADVVGFPDIR